MSAIEVVVRSFSCLPHPVGGRGVLIFDLFKIRKFFAGGVPVE